ncbi:MAG: polysaccharide deacetylase family protein [Anaerolineae bacterium]|nr:polysaccharide deacetylase family protein [Anaerolineae bacterium]
MPSLLTIIMYHYVRDVQGSRFPDIKGLTVEQFSAQIDYIKKYYTVVGGRELLDAIAPGGELPPRAALLTFDDGYIDHLLNVYPILDRNHLSACFFPVAKAVLEHHVLNVNKIHFVLASTTDKEKIISRIYHWLDEYRASYELPSNNDYWIRLAVAGRFDTPEIVFTKHLLQRELPTDLRDIITSLLFGEFVTSDETAFASELYMNNEQLVSLYRSGMYIGGHGYSHNWLNTLDRAEQERDIDAGLDFIKSVGDSPGGWIFSYPYGAYNDSLLSVLRDRGFNIGLTLHVGIARLDADQLLTLPRLNTNDLPKLADSSPNDWTRQVIGEGQAVLH